MELLHGQIGLMCKNLKVCALQGHVQGIGS